MSGKYTFKLRNVLENIVIVPFVLYAFWGLSPYFTWKSFYGGVFGYIGGIPYSSIFGALSIFVGAFYIINQKKLIKKNAYLLLGALISAFSIVLLGGGIEHAFSFEWIIFIVPAIYILLPINVKAKCFDAYYWLIVITLIAPIIVYLLVHIGINVPHMEIMSDEGIKSSSGYTYIIYPLASQWSRYGITYYALRLCGIYNEPGLLGTVVALILVQQEFKLKNNWKNCILFVAGILSFSLGFYMLTIIYFLLKNVTKLSGKKLIIILCIIFAYLIFISINFSNPDIANFQSRIILTAKGLSGDTRTNAVYDIEFANYLHSDFWHLLFGYGHGALEAILNAGNIDGCSYKTLFYDYGVVGVLLQVIWLLYLVFVEKKGMDHKYYIETLIFLAVYIINMYQRPSMFAFCYLLIISGGIYSKKLERIKTQKVKESYK